MRVGDAGDGLVAELRANGAYQPLFFQGNVAVASEVGSTMDVIAETTGRIDVLVISAGTRETQDFFEMESAEWERVLSINLGGVFFSSQAAAHHIRLTGGGSIVNVASVAGLIGVPHRPAYTATKHGVVGLTKSMSLDLAAHNIRVNAICPGVIRTPLTEHYFAHERFTRDRAVTVPHGRHGETDDVANAALFLASDLSSYVTGIALPVDGGFLASKSFLVGDVSADFFMGDPPSQTDPASSHMDS